MMVWLLFIIDLMGLFFYNKIGSIRSIGDLPTTNIIEPFFRDKKTSKHKLLVFWLLFHLSFLKERILIMNLGHRDYDHVILFHVVLGVIFLV